MPDMSIAIAIMLGSFIILLMLRMPISFTLGISSALTALYLNIPLATVFQRMVSGVQSFSLLAIPFFILAGEIMGQGGISRRLIALANACVGWMRGGLAQVNILASMFFGGISGSAVADTSSIGSILIPMMTDSGYDKDFSVAVTVTSSCQGVMIPPSHNMILFAMAAGGGVSIGQLFVAGYMPGAVLSIVLMIYSYYYSKKMNIPVTGKFNLKNCIKAFFKAIWGMLAVMFVVVGVIAGVFTTTESAAAAVVWSLCVGLFIYKGFSFKDIPHIFANVVETLGKVLILLGVSGAFTYLLTYLRIPTMIATGLFSITSNKIIILILLNILMLCLGCLIEMACLILMLTPVILPIWMQLGLSPIHLGIVMVLNLGIGLLTPPVGSTLFIGSAISGIKIETLSKKMVPFYITMFIALIILTYFPQTFMWLANLLY